MDDNQAQIARKTTKKEHNTTKNNMTTVLTEIRKNSEVELSKNKLRMIQETIRAISTSKDQKEASIVLGITEQSMYARMKRYPQIRQGLQRLKEITIESVKDRIVFNTPKLADNTLQLADNAVSENVRLQANLELLAIGGIQKAPQTNVQVNVLNQINKDRDEYK